MYIQYERDVKQKDHKKTRLFMIKQPIYSQCASVGLFVITENGLYSKFF
jgi:hypothetical protein